MRSKFLILFFIIISFFSCGQRNPLFNDLENNDPEPDKIYPPLYYHRNEYWISRVIEYCPAWGQFVNNPNYNQINKIYGPPEGRGTVSGSQEVISLGSGGGYVIIQFSPAIEDHPDNIKGYDFIIFGNGSWQNNDPDKHWQEPGYVEVMKDINSNGLPDDTWYLLKGSDTFLNNISSVTYHRTDALYKPSDKNQYPDAVYYSGYPDQKIFQIYLFPAEKAGQVDPEIWGYADVTPVLRSGDLSGADGHGDNSLSDPEDDPDIDPVYFYTMPDEQGDKKIDPGSGGGDAFKIEWAVDQNTGIPVILDQIDFIKITCTATNKKAPVGEVSTEIDAVSRVLREK